MVLPPPPPKFGLHDVSPFRPGLSVFQVRPFQHETHWNPTIEAWLKELKESVQLEVDHDFTQKTSRLVHENMSSCQTWTFHKKSIGSEGPFGHDDDIVRAHVLELVRPFAGVAETSRCELWAGNINVFPLRSMRGSITHFTVSIKNLHDGDVEVREVSAPEICKTFHGDDNGVFIFMDSSKRTVMVWFKITLPRNGDFIHETIDTPYVGVLRHFVKFVVATDAHSLFTPVEDSEQDSEQDPDILFTLNGDQRAQLMWTFNRDGRERKADVSEVITTLEQEITEMMPKILGWLGRTLVSNPSEHDRHSEMTNIHSTLQRCIDDLKQVGGLSTDHKTLKREARKLMSRATNIMKDCGSEVVNGPTKHTNDMRPVKMPKLGPMKSPIQLPDFDLEQTIIADECLWQCQQLRQELRRMDDTIEHMLNGNSKRVRVPGT